MVVEILSVSRKAVKKVYAADSENDGMRSEEEWTVFESLKQIVTAVLLLVCLQRQSSSQK